MTSQFLILPQYHRKGYGLFLLEEIYSYYKGIKECIQISTEDPAKEFEILRDIEIFKKNFRNGNFERFLKQGKVKSKEEYNNIKFTKDELNDISHDLKVSKEILCVSLDILKYYLITNSAVNNENELNLLLKEFKKDVKLKLFKAAREDYEVDYDFNRRKKNKKRRPFIYFHDEEEKMFDIDKLELQQMSENEVKETLENNSLSVINDIKSISKKCGSLVKDYLKIYLE